jgi:hypothetical protein
MQSRDVFLALAAGLAFAACYPESMPTPPPPPPPPAPEAAAPSPLEGWFVSGEAHRAYTATVDSAVPHAGHASIVFHATGETAARYATYMTEFDAAAFRGRRVRASVWVRTDGVTSRGDFWVRAQPQGAAVDAPGLAHGSQRLLPTADFTRYEVVVDVPPGTGRLELGLGIAGPGELWMDGVRVELVGAAVAPTPSVGDESQCDGWMLSGAGRGDYTIMRDGVVTHDSRSSVALLPIRSPSGRYAMIIRDFDASPLRGRRVRASAWVRTEGITSRGEFWVRAQGAGSPAEGQGLASGGRPLAPTSDFARYEVELVVPPGAMVLQVGIGLAGGGRLWVEGARVEPEDALPAPRVDVPHPDAPHQKDL